MNLRYGENSQLTLQIPPNAVTETVALVLQIVTPQSTPTGFTFGGQGFTLDVALNSAIQAEYHFQHPITVTLDYNEDKLGNIAEESLLLFFFDEAQQAWIDAAKTCTPPSQYDRQLDVNRVQVAICHLTEFAIFGPNEQRLYLPYIQR